MGEAEAAMDAMASADALLFCRGLIRDLKRSAFSRMPASPEVRVRVHAYGVRRGWRWMPTAKTFTLAAPAGETP